MNWFRLVVDTGSGLVLKAGSGQILNWFWLVVDTGSGLVPDAG